MLADTNTALSGGSVQWRTGVQEANPEATAIGTLLVTFTLPSPFAPTAVGADGAAQTLVGNAIANATAVASGIAGHFRALSSGGTCVLVGDIGTSGADLNVSTTTVTSGSAYSMGALAVPFPY